MFSYYAAQHASSIFRRCCSVKWLNEFSVNPVRSPGCLRNFSVGSNGYWNKDFGRNPDMQNGKGNMTSTYASGFARQDNYGNFSVGSNGYMNKDFGRNPDMQYGKGNMTSTYASGFARQDNFGNFSVGSNGYMNKDFGRNPDMQNVKGNMTSTYASGFGRQDNFGNSMECVREALSEGRRGFWHFQSNVNKEVNPDIVHIKHMRNNTFVTVTDSKGNRKCGASSGCLSELKGGPKLSRYAAEATAEHVGRLARNLGLKSVVMRVNGFTHFKKKRQSIMSFKEGFTSSRTDKSPIVYVEDTTRRAHNGCRLPKKRRV